MKRIGNLLFALIVVTVLIGSASAFFEKKVYAGYIGTSRCDNCVCANRNPSNCAVVDGWPPAY